jgi:hypothetical protein
MRCEEGFKISFKKNFWSRKSFVFSLFERSNPNFALLSKQEIYNPRDTLALPHSQIRNIKFPK